jgi:hypothetical protein
VGELLLRVPEAAPGASGVGIDIDIHGPDLARGRENAEKRGLSGRVYFIEGPVADHASPADVVISCGAYQAFGTVFEALRALRVLVKPAGLLLFGAEIWDRTPTDEQLASMWPGMTADDCLSLPDLVEAATAEGFRPLCIQTATRGEWEEFESGLAAGAEEWLLANGAHPEAGQVRAKLARPTFVFPMGQTRDIRNGKGTAETGTSGADEDHRERPGDHERAERDLLLASGATQRQQRDAVDGRQEEPGEGTGQQGAPAEPGQQTAQARS